MWLRGLMCCDVTAGFQILLVQTDVGWTPPCRCCSGWKSSWNSWSSRVGEKSVLAIPQCCVHSLMWFVYVEVAGETLWTAPCVDCTTHLGLWTPCSYPAGSRMQRSSWCACLTCSGNTTLLASGALCGNCSWTTCRHSGQTQRTLSVTTWSSDWRKHTAATRKYIYYTTTWLL